MMPVSLEHKQRMLKHGAEETRKKAENAIQQILIDLTDDAACDIDAVNVDTRPFGNLKVEIFFEQ